MAKKASNRGHEKAVIDMLDIYKREKKYEQYITLAEKNVDVLSDENFYWLCSYYRNGRGTNKDYDKAAMYLDRIDVEKGDIEKRKVASIYYEISKSVYFTKGGHEKSFKLCSRAANLGLARALAGLAKKYSAGLGVEKDEVKSYELWKEAVKAGSAFSMKDLLLCEYYGRGTEKNMENAKLWYNKLKEIYGASFEKFSNEFFPEIAKEMMVENKKVVDRWDLIIQKKVKKEKELNKRGFRDPFDRK